MVGDLLFETCSDVFSTEPVHKQLREFEDARQETADFAKKCWVVFCLRDPFVVLAHHGYAGGGRDAHYLCIAKHGDEAAYQRNRLTVISGVVVHLAAAGLFQREGDPVAHPL